MAQFWLFHRCQNRPLWPRLGASPSSIVACLACVVAWAAIRGVISQSGTVMSELQKGLVEAGVTESAAADRAAR